MDEHLAWSHGDKAPPDPPPRPPSTPRSPGPQHRRQETLSSSHKAAAGKSRDTGEGTRPAFVWGAPPYASCSSLCFKFRSSWRSGAGTSDLCSARSARLGLCSQEVWVLGLQTWPQGTAGFEASSQRCVSEEGPPGTQAPQPLRAGRCHLEVAGGLLLKVQTHPPSPVMPLTQPSTPGPLPPSV